MSHITNDPWTLQREVRKAYLLHRQGLLTDKDFTGVVSESVRKTTNFTDAELTPTPAHRVTDSSTQGFSS